MQEVSKLRQQLEEAEKDASSGGSDSLALEVGERDISELLKASAPLLVDV